LKLAHGANLEQPNKKSNLFSLFSQSLVGLEKCFLSAAGVHDEFAAFRGIFKTQRKAAIDDSPDSKWSKSALLIRATVRVTALSAVQHVSAKSQVKMATA
jgi:hypothetical protein